MRALIFVGDGRVEWQERPDPEVRERTDAVVRPVAATTCDLDGLILRGEAPVPKGFAIGHECVAEVVETGDGVTHVVPGDLVVVPWHIACGRCDRCRRGLFAHCRTVPYAAMFGLPLGGDYGGLFSDLVRVPYADAMLVPLRDGADPIALASAGDNWSLAWRMVAPHLQVTPGGSVLIMSIGSIGLYACDIAGALGASRRLYVDPDPENRAIAESYGAETAESIEAIPQGFDIAIEATGTVAALSSCCRSLEPEGVCESAGNHYASDTQMPLLEMYVRGVNFRVGRDSVRANIEPALDLVQTGRVDPRRVVSEVLDWETLPEMLPQAGRKPVFVRHPLSVPTP